MHIVPKIWLNGPGKSKPCAAHQALCALTTAESRPPNAGSYSAPRILYFGRFYPVEIHLKLVLFFQQGILFITNFFYDFGRGLAQKAFIF